MIRTFEAIIENGALRPVAEMFLIEGQKVTVTINDESETGAAKPSDLAQWLQTHGKVSDEDTALALQAIEEAFEQVNPNAWD